MNYKADQLPGGRYWKPQIQAQLLLPKITTPTYVIACDVIEYQRWLKPGNEANNPTGV